MIRRELPRTSSAGLAVKAYRIIFVEGSPYRGPSAVIGSAIQLYVPQEPTNSRASGLTTWILCLPRCIALEKPLLRSLC